MVYFLDIIIIYLIIKYQKMNKETELLERFYISFINLDDPKDFFYGLRDYIDFVKESPDFNRILAKLLYKKETFEDSLKKLDLIAIRKLSGIYKELSDYISQNKITENNTINEALGSYNSWLNNKTTGLTNPEGLYEDLYDIIQCLYEITDHKEFASRYIIFNTNKSYVKYYLYPKEYKEYYESLKDFKEKYKSELWGQMNEVIRYYQIIKKGKEKRKELVKSATEDNDLNATYELILSHNSLLGEWINIEEGKYHRLQFFDIKKFRPTMVRFHNYLLKELSRPPKDYFANFSLENLIKAQKVLKIVLDELELQSGNRLFGNKIPIKKLEKEDILFSEAEAILDKIDCVVVMNEELKPFIENKLYNKPLVPPLFSEKEVNENIFLLVDDFNEIRKIAEETENKIKKEREQLEKTQNKKQEKEPDNKKIEKTILFLNKQGDLCNKAKNKCYPMGGKSKRCKLIIFLVKNKGYQETSLITNEIGYNSNQMTSTEIRKIKNNIKKFLKIDGDDLLLSRKGSGYKINSIKYKIKLKDE